MTACTHGMPTPASCVDCMDEGNIAPSPRPEAPAVEYVFTARFSGQCAGCNLPIAVGQRVARLTNATYRHEGCA